MHHNGGHMYTFSAMNTQFLLDGLKKEQCEEAKQYVLQAEATLSRFSSDSELSEINAKKGEWVRVSQLTFQLLKEALLGFQETEGLFNPFLGAEIKKAGYNKSFELLIKEEQKAKILNKADTDFNLPKLQQERHCSAATQVQFDAKNMKINLAKHADLDLGGIAKGWVAQRLAEQFIGGGINAGLIDAGGDIVVWGKEPRQQVWGIEVANPFDPKSGIADLWIEDFTAIATSNVMKRSWLNIDGQRSNHIIDPRTGLSAESDLVQATVLSGNLTKSEQYAKCLLILGSEKGLPFLVKHSPDSAYIVVNKDGTLIASSNLASYCSEWKL